MPSAPKKNRELPKFLFLIVLAVVATLIIYSAIHPTPWSWPVPEQAKQLKNPLQPSPTALDSAKNIYLAKCANCHGDSGKGDGRDAASSAPQPADFTDPKSMTGDTEGELF
jgi:mono/diheme cytochrome c family protein